MPFAQVEIVGDIMDTRGATAFYQDRDTGDLLAHAIIASRE